MARDLTPGAKAAVEAGHVNACWLIKMDFSISPAAMTTAPFDILFDGTTYRGVGSFGGVGPIEEDVEATPHSIQVNLSGIPIEWVSTVLDEHYQGREILIYLATMNEQHQIYADPTLMFRGSMDTMGIKMGETATVILTAESRMADWNRPRIRRYNSEDQKSRFPNDKGLEFVVQMVETEIYWGRI